MLFDLARPTFAAFNAPLVSGLVDKGDFIFFVASRPESFAEKSLLEGRSLKNDICLLFRPNNLGGAKQWWNVSRQVDLLYLSHKQCKAVRRLSG